MIFNYVLPSSFKEMTKICLRTMKIIILKCGEIWFPRRNMVLCSEAVTIYQTAKYIDKIKEEYA